MTPPKTGAYVRLCSSVLAPLVLLALLWPGRTDSAATTTSRSRSTAVALAIPHELPDGVHAKVVRKRAPVKTPPPVASPVVGKTSVFSGLGAWVDVYDFDTLPVDRTVATLRAAGVRTLYVETGMTGTRQAVAPKAVPWLIAGHRAGLKVVAWYLPYYVNVPLDVARTVWIARFHYHGFRFDGVGVDIEFKGAQPNNAKWNANVVSHMNAVRRTLGPAYPLAAIPPPPLQMQLAPSTWRGFPWKALGRASSEIMLMSYWSFRSGCPQVRMACPYEYTKYNVLVTRQLVGSNVPIHIIGGVGDHINHAQLVSFIQGALDAGADGASIYDIATTNPAWWRSLRYLRKLGS